MLNLPIQAAETAGQIVVASGLIAAMMQGDMPRPKLRSNIDIPGVENIVRMLPTRVEPVLQEENGKTSQFARDLVISFPTVLAENTVITRVWEPTGYADANGFVAACTLQIDRLNKSSGKSEQTWQRMAVVTGKTDGYSPVNLKIMSQDDADIDLFMDTDGKGGSVLVGLDTKKTVNPLNIYRWSGKEMVPIIEPLQPLQNRPDPELDRPTVFYSDSLRTFLVCWKEFGSDSGPEKLEIMGIDPSGNITIPRQYFDAGLDKLAEKTDNPAFINSEGYQTYIFPEKTSSRAITIALPHSNEPSFILYESTYTMGSDGHLFQLQDVHPIYQGIWMGGINADAGAINHFTAVKNGGNIHVVYSSGGDYGPRGQYEYLGDRLARQAVVRQDGTIDDRPMTPSGYRMFPQLVMMGEAAYLTYLDYIPGTDRTDILAVDESGLFSGIGGSIRSNRNRENLNPGDYERPAGANLMALVVHPDKNELVLRLKK